MYSVIVQVFTIGMHFLITLNIRQIHYEHFLGISFDSYIQVLLGTPYSKNIDLVTIFTSNIFLIKPYNSSSPIYLISIHAFEF